MALTVTSRGTGTHNTGATTLVPGGRSATLAVGSMGVLCIALDNAGTAGAALIAPDSWTDAKGNVWTLRQNALYDNGAASAGIEMAIYTAPITVALLTTDAGTMTWKSGSPVAKAWTWYEVIPSAGNSVEYSTGGTIAGATAANAQVVTASVLVGDAVIAGYFSENVNAVTGDSDSINGSWTAQQTTTIGSTTSGVRIATQQKVQTTTPSTQSYDVTVASQDRIAGYIMLHEAATNRNGLFTATGGGVTVAAIEKGALQAIVATGGGSAATVGSGDRQSGITATGGGVLTWDYEGLSVENHDGSFVATGGGVAVAVSSTDRSGSPTATGGGVAAAGASTERSAALSGTGGGIAAVTQSAERGAGLVATGGGTVSLSVLAGRQLAAALSGGGIIAVDASTERAAAFIVTGGGVAVVTGTQGEDHSADFSTTGGGAWTIATAVDRLGSLSASGGGLLAFGTEAARNGSFAATGGGVYTSASGVMPIPPYEARTVALSVAPGDAALIAASLVVGLEVDTA